MKTHVNQLEVSNFAGDSQRKHDHGCHEVTGDGAAPKDEPGHGEEEHVEVGGRCYYSDDVIIEWYTWENEDWHYG